MNPRPHTARVLLHTAKSSGVLKGASGRCLGQQVANTAKPWP